MYRYFVVQFSIMSEQEMDMIMALGIMYVADTSARNQETAKADPWLTEKGKTESTLVRTAVKTGQSELVQQYPYLRKGLRGRPKPCPRPAHVKQALSSLPIYCSVGQHHYSKEKGHSIKWDKPLDRDLCAQALWLLYTCLSDWLLEMNVVLAMHLIQGSDTEGGWAAQGRGDSYPCQCFILLLVSKSDVCMFLVKKTCILKNTLSVQILG